MFLLFLEVIFPPVSIKKCRFAEILHLGLIIPNTCVAFRAGAPCRHFMENGDGAVDEPGERGATLRGILPR